MKLVGNVVKYFRLFFSINFNKLIDILVRLR